MSIDDLLSDEEMSALMQAVNDGDLPPKTRPPGTQEPATKYDFTAPGRIIHSFLPTLEMINDRFTRSLRLSLFNILRRYAELTTAGVRVMSLTEYIATLPNPTSINMVAIKPLRGTALVVFEAQLVSSIVDSLFGGSGKALEAERSEFTAAEQRIVRTLLERVFEDLKGAWSSTMALEFSPLRSETNPQFATVTGAGESEVMIVTLVDVALEGGGGAMHLLMPYSMLEPLRERLTARIQNVGLERDTRFKTSLLEGVAGVEVWLDSTLLEVEITLDELLRLKRGDVIPVTIPPRVTLEVEGVPVYDGVYGSSKRTRAVKLTGPARRS